MTRKSKEVWKIYENVFDRFTIRTLFHLAGQGMFDGLKSPIAIGKESNVFTAEKGDDLVIVKIYRLESCDFNRMLEYISTDPRFLELKGRKRQIIFAWTQREYRNLMLARTAGVRCPKPHQFENNVLVMDMIGEKKPAPRLSKTAPKKPKQFYEELIDQYKKLITKAKICHGDLSEYNLLNDNEKPAFIDFSHGTPMKSVLGKQLYKRDCQNISRYFSKIWKNITVEKVMNDIGVKT